MKSTFLEDEKTALLHEIRSYLAGKETCAPVCLSAGEFKEWQKEHEKYFLHTGQASIWGGVKVPPGAEEVVIQKARADTKPYLLFDDVRKFEEYCRNAELLGVASVAFCEKETGNKISEMARFWGVADAAGLDLQEEVEKGIGLYFFETGDVTASDSQLRGRLVKYYKSTVMTKMWKIFPKYKENAYVDILEWEEILPGNKSAEEEYFSDRAAKEDVNQDNPDTSRLYGQIVDIVERQTGNKDKRFDMKDCLLGQIVQSDSATKVFLSSYYDDLQDRKNMWRAIALTYQVYYAHENGQKYLKNPAFVRACGSMLIGDMLKEQMHVLEGAGCNRKAPDNIYALWDRLREENQLDTPLIKCAANAEQIGKALSKELRETTASAPLAKALLVRALEYEGILDPAGQKGEGYHE